MLNENECDSDENLTTDAVPEGNSPEDYPDKKSDPIFSPKKENVTNNIPSSTSKPKLPKHGTKNKTQSKASQKLVQYNISNASNVHIGSNYVVNVNKPQESEPNCKPKENVQKTQQIEEIMCSKKPVTRSVMMCASTHIGKNWRDIGKRLDLSNGQLDQFYETYIKISMKEVIYQMLLDWTQDKPEMARLGNLSTILWECNEREAVERLSSEFNDNI